MGWLKKILEALGLEEEQINKIVEAYKTESVKHVMPKDKYNEVNTENKTLKATIKERDTQLDELKKHSQSNEDLKAQINKLQEDNEQAKQKYEQDLYNTRLNSAIDSSLIGAKAKDINIAKSAFKLGDIKLENGKLIGFDEQLKTIQETHSYLFDNDVKPNGTGGSMGNGGKKSEEQDPFLKGLGLI